MISFLTFLYHKGNSLDYTLLIYPLSGSKNLAKAQSSGERLIETSKAEEWQSGHHIDIKGIGLRFVHQLPTTSRISAWENCDTSFRSVHYTQMLLPLRERY